jgi:hypothetical protein
MSQERKAFCSHCAWHGNKSQLISVSPPSEPHYHELICPVCKSQEVDVQDEKMPDEIFWKSCYDTAIEIVGFNKRRMEEYATITRHLEDVAGEWQEKYEDLQKDRDHAKAILSELVELKIMKDSGQNTADYEARKPKVWSAARKYVMHNIRPSQLVYADALVDVNGKIKHVRDTLTGLLKHYEKQRRAEKDAVDFHNNNTPGVGQGADNDYRTLSPEPEWVAQAQSALKELSSIGEVKDTDLAIENERLKSDLYAISRLVEDGIDDMKKHFKESEGELDRATAIGVKVFLKEMKVKVDKMLEYHSPNKPIENGNDLATGSNGKH